MGNLRRAVSGEFITVVLSTSQVSFQSIRIIQQRPPLLESKLNSLNANQTFNSPTDIAPHILSHNHHIWTLSVTVKPTLLPIQSPDFYLKRLRYTIVD